MRTSFKAALEKTLKGQTIAKEDLVTLLETTDPEEINTLFSTADATRQRQVGDEVHFRGIIEFSNHCERNCLYCGLRRENKNLKRYRMTPEEITQVCDQAATSGFKTIVLQSGEDNNYSAGTLANLIGRIKDEHDIAITLSLGEKQASFYQCLREAGADRYLIKHETANPELFARLRPGTSLQKRLDCIKELKKQGFEVGSGNMVGLPGQSLDVLAEDILLMRELDIDMAGVGPFVPSEHTPLTGSSQGDLFLTLKVIALTRLALPWCNIPATTALGTIDHRGREMALGCGANVIMPNITPPALRKHYQIYPGKESLFDGPGKPENLQALIQSMGRKVSSGKGSTLENRLSYKTKRRKEGVSNVF